jgi:hypothetical protein
VNHTGPIDPALIAAWHRALAAWAGQGRLARAAAIALDLPADHPGLGRLEQKLAAGDFADLPPIRDLDWEAMEGIPCAYLEQERLILINRDWLEDALEEQVIAVLSEQLGHHLDALFNSQDTAGDEGELFLECLRGDPSEELIAALRSRGDAVTLQLDGALVAVEESGAGAHCLDPRDLD